MGRRARSDYTFAALDSSTLQQLQQLKGMAHALQQNKRSNGSNGGAPGGGQGQATDRQRGRPTGRDDRRADGRRRIPPRRDQSPRSKTAAVADGRLLLFNNMTLGIVLHLSLHYLAQEENDRTGCVAPTMLACLALRKHEHTCSTGHHRRLRRHKLAI